MSARPDSGAAVEGDATAEVVDGGPGLAYMPFVIMEDLLDKLKLLNYEEVRQSLYTLSVFESCFCCKPHSLSHAGICKGAAHAPPESALLCASNESRGAILLVHLLVCLAGEKSQCAI